MSDRSIQSLDLSIIAFNDAAITLGGKLVVLDNLEESVSETNRKMTLVPKERFPMKPSLNTILIVVKGTISFSVNFRDYVVTEGMCVAIVSGTIIEQASISDDAQIILLSFSQYDMPNMSSYQQRNVHRLYALQVVQVTLLPIQVEMLLSSYRILRTILSDPAFVNKKEETAYNCISLMTSIIENGASPQSELVSKSSRKDEIVARFLECVNENYRERRDLGFYANQLCLSLKYMSQVVYEQTGRHPSQWIKDYVILDAKAMLRSGRYTVQQVADELHFPNQSFFGKYFKESVGVSPKKWK